MERVPQIYLNENYRNLSQLHACPSRCFLFFTMQRIIPYNGLPSVLINVMVFVERVVLEYGEVLIKNNW